ncbi:unnamed protein product [Enterobius vermicularis]|uniref:Protein-serine/threonine phosphatase n=1 Tax=Enterobius vermicularis TaxID=51028 RepID=A0A0N4UXS3_ENTVE|nr:unnamed protein product [Enterobius vermicularis]
MNENLRRPCAMLQTNLQRHFLFFDKFRSFTVFFLCFILIGSHNCFIVSAADTNYQLRYNFKRYHSSSGGTTQHIFTKSRSHLLDKSSHPLSNVSAESVANLSLTTQTVPTVRDFSTDSKGDSSASGRSRSLQVQLDASSRTNHDRSENISPNYSASSDSNISSPKFVPYEQPNGIPYLSKANSAGRRFLSLLKREDQSKQLQQELQNSPDAGNEKRYNKRHPDKINSDPTPQSASHGCLDGKCQVKKSSAKFSTVDDSNKSPPLVIISSDYGGETHAEALPNVGVSGAFRGSTSVNSYNSADARGSRPYASSRYGDRPYGLRQPYRTYNRNRYSDQFRGRTGGVQYESAATTSEKSYSDDAAIGSSSTLAEWKSKIRGKSDATVQPSSVLSSSRQVASSGRRKCISSALNGQKIANSGNSESDTVICSDTDTVSDKSSATVSEYTREGNLESKVS